MRLLVCDRLVKETGLNSFNFRVNKYLCIENLQIEIFFDISYNNFLFNLSILDTDDYPYHVETILRKILACLKVTFFYICHTDGRFWMIIRENFTLELKHLAIYEQV